MILIQIARALIACLAPLTGTRAAGHVTVRPAAGHSSATLPRNAYGVPIVDGALRYDRILKTKAGAGTGGVWAIASGGTDVDVWSNVGGADQNLAAGTSIRWFPAIDDVELVSTVAPGGTTGGAAPTGLCQIGQIALLDELPAGNPGDLVQRGVITRFPAVVLSWAGSAGDSSIGKGVFRSTETFDLWLLCSRQDSDSARRLEGLALMDAMRDLMRGREIVDGQTVSSPHGLLVDSRKPFLAHPTLCVYKLSAKAEVSTRLTSETAWATWDVLRLEEKTTDSTPFSTVVDCEVDMP